MDKRYTIINDNCLDALDRIEENSIDCIITDPPYGLTTITKRFGKENSAPNQYGKDGSFQRLTKGFMGQEWDGSGIEYNVELWSKALKTLKPGGYLLAFGGTRTFHRIACAIEDAGFEIRDTIMWLYGSGFPKSLNIGLAIDKKNGCGDRGHRIAVASRYHPDGTFEPNGEYLEPYEAKTEIGKKWQGWGTALKPAYEPIIVARKPIEKSVVENVMKYGVGGINIDACRIAFNGDKWNSQKSGVSSRAFQSEETTTAGGVCEANENGRFPSNVILTYDDTDFNEVCGGFPNTKAGSIKPHKNNANAIVNKMTSENITSSFNGDSGSASRYFYCAKASAKDRDDGLNEFELQNGIRVNAPRENETLKTLPRKNIHPTVKPTELMQYLIRLVAPKGATIMDIFMGSGSTGKAVAYENKEYQKDYKFIGIELSKEYCEIAKARIEYADKYVISSIEKETRERDVAPEQISIFDIEV